MCKVGTVRYIARKNNWDIRDVEASLEQEVKRDSAGTHTTVKVVLNIEGDITDEQRAELLKQADNCYIHRLLNGAWDIQPIQMATENL
jgi:putative redox protein